MANPGVGNKFVSVNLNKSYVQSSHANQSNSSSNHHYGSGRGRSGGGGGSGMVVLSRPRSSHKAGPKLSVPPPLNLPSLRKEHEKFDSLGSGAGSVGGGVPGSGARPSSSGMGWSKPTAIVPGDGAAAAARSTGGDRPVSSDGVDSRLQAVDAVHRGGGNGAAYMPPSARSSVVGPEVSVPLLVEKATVLRGEDFPSLKATLSVVNGTVQKHKDPTHQKQKQGMSDETAGGHREGSYSSSNIDMRPQLQSAQPFVVGVSSSRGGGSIRDNHNSASSRPQHHIRKQDDYFPGPLPLVRLSPRSDWADDERDTSHAFAERGRDHHNSYPRTEPYWDRDFDFPQSSFPPHKSAQNHFDRRGHRDNDVGKDLSNEVFNADPFSRDVRATSREGREGQLWRAPGSRDGFATQDVVSDRNIMGARPISVSRETSKDNGKYTPAQVGGNNRDGHSVGLSSSRDFAAGRRDPGYVQGGRQQWNTSADRSSGRGPEKDRYGSESNRYKADIAQSSMGSRSSFSAASKGLSGSDMSNFGRDKRSFSRGEKPYVEDPFLKDWGTSGFDGQDPFTGGILGVVKRKKDANKQLDFHDPVRESFEAELERVQKMQEQERQRMIEEQERAMEMARREEEERLRLLREQEAHQRRLEEEAREAAWRAEQEKLEALRRAEEQRIAREEEKQRIVMEEERRKQGAKQKLLELEEKIAKREADSAKAEGSSSQGDVMAVGVKERDASRADDFTGWEDGERMVERITNTASSDSSISRPSDMGSRPAREGSFAFADRGKQFNSWKRDVFDGNSSSSFFSADHESSHQSPRRDGSVGGRAFPRKDFCGGPGYMPRSYYRGGIAEPHIDDFPHARGHRWNISSDGDPYGRNTELEAEFQDSIADKFDMGWGQGRGRGNSPFPERFYHNVELDELYTYGRSRYPARQPRVLPPPSLPLVHRNSYRNESGHSASSGYEDRKIQFNQTSRSEPAAVGYQNVHEEHSNMLDVQEQSAKNGEQEPRRSTTPGCDSQSSLSVSSAPSSPTHLSHDDLDESRDTLAASGTADSQGTSHSENEAVLINAKTAEGGRLTTSSSISVGDDEEWTVENNEELQEQEEYDEDAGYHEEDEAHEGDDENAGLSPGFQDMRLEGKGSPPPNDNSVLGFDQGVEVGMPNDEYEVSPRIDGSLYVQSQVSVGGIEQKESVDRSTGGQSPQHTDASPHVGADSSSVTVQESEKAIQDYVCAPLNASHSIAADPLNAGDSSNSVLPAQQSVPSPVGAISQSSSQAAPTGAVAQGSSELPVKLQFGLFSGPSLIPSPVPAIQIGSIQMPLQLHPQIGPSLAHMHAPQPPLFQFGQLRYPAPISQGILPLGPPSMSFVQPNVPPSYPSSQVHGGPLISQPAQEFATQNSMKDDSFSLTGNSHNMQPSNQVIVGHNAEKEANTKAGQGAGSDVHLKQNQGDASCAPMDQVRPESAQQVEAVGRRYTVRNSKPLLNSRALDSRAQGGSSSSHYAANFGPTLQGQLPGNKGRRFAFTARNSGARLSFPVNEVSRIDTNGYQRRPRRGMQRFEFRVRQASDSKQSSALLSSSNTGLDAKPNSDGKGSGTQPRGGSKKEVPYDRPKQSKQQSIDSETSSSEQIMTHTGSGVREDRPAGKETLASGLDNSRRSEGRLKRNISPEDDVDAPLQSGVVRIFKQPGIEAPSDEDDFIEVRSKRQMLNDRREQREKEIKAKSSNMRKPQRKSRPTPQGVATVRTNGKTSASSTAHAAKGIRNAVSSKQGLNNEVSAALNNIVSQTLGPIGTPSVTADVRADPKAETHKELQTSSYSTSGQIVESDMTFNAPNKIPGGVHSSVGSWDNPRTNQPVMALTQTQLEEAMKPVQFDKSMVAIGDQSSSISEPGIASSSVISKDCSFSSATSPISSLLAGEKIQFGAVTSPTILPSSTRVVSHGIRPPPSSQLNIQISRSTPASQNDCALLFEKEKHSNESCPPLEDCEAEAEAAASAVAVAAISNDEMLGNGIGGSASISDTKGFGSGDMGGTAGMCCEQQPMCQSKGEETLSVSLPADLSVETPPISLWPPLPSPHSSSNQMLSPFPGGPTSHIPYYDMNSMMGGPVFAFGPHEESAGPQSQPQKNSIPNSGPLGTWQQCHTGVDSFYGPAAGFTAPFISPPGSIPGVQGPSHMVFYNHFAAPVGQYAQVGLSYMGTTYIPSGKQPDWKHNTSSPMGGDGDMNNLNVVPVQRNAPNVPAQVQHLAPGSPLLSMASPLAMFEVSPFQNSPDPSAHARWSHVQGSTIHSIPQSMPLQQQTEGAGPTQFVHGSADQHLLSVDGFPKPQTSSSLEDGRSFGVDANTAVTQFPDELGLVDPVSSDVPEASVVDVGNKSRPGSTVADSVRVDAVSEGSGSKRNPQVTVSASHKAQSAQQKNPTGQLQYNNYQRGGTQKGSAAEWSNRKMGFHGRNHSSGGERGFPPTKVKQIYVAKQSTGGNSSSL